jgi:hypothetical protein
MKTIKYFLLPLFFTSLLVAHEPVHSSVSAYYENIDFKNSVQKYEGKLLGVGADIHSGDSAYKFAYEGAKTQTKQPPLKDDLTTQKLFLKYMHTFENDISVNLNYIDVLADNIAPTANGVAYGGGLGYDMNKNIYVNFTQFYTDYKEFNVYQSDLKIDYKTKMDSVGMKFTAMAKYIHMDDYTDNSFSENANEDYFTTAFKFHSHYQSYHFGTAAYFGKRVFAIMDDGFKIQHHAMEFDRTYAIGFGKSFSNLVLRLQYVYQRATELPAENKNVEVRNFRIITDYRF